METMAMVLNHLYMELDPKQPGQEQELWDLCWDVCYMMYPDEIWIEDYACCIGRMMHEKGWYSECDEWFQRYYMMEPDHPSYAANWALCLVKRGEMQRAQTLLDTALQENSECDGTSLEYYLIAKQLYRAMGKQEQEKLCAERICGLDEYLLEDEPNFLEEDLSKIF